MIRFAVVALALLAACGGSSDPCSGQSGVCVRAHVSSEVSGVDQLDVSRVGGGEEVTPSKATNLKLPRDFAMLLPTSTVGTSITVTVKGLAAGTAIASDTQTFAVAAQGNMTVDFELHASTATDAGIPDLGGDGGSTADLGPPVCGNGVVESGEACDDGNLDNGDGCDPTCQYTNTLSRLAGEEESQGFANLVGTDARFSQIGMMTTDGTYLYVPDGQSSTIRRVDPTTGATTVWLGQVGDSESMSGNAVSARFLGPSDSSFSTFTTPNVVYTLDHDLLSTKVSLACTQLGSANLTTSVTSLGAKYRAVFTGTYSNASNVFLISDNGVSAFTISGTCTMSSSSPLLSASALSAMGVDPTTCTTGVGVGTDLYVGCRSYIVHYNGSAFSKIGNGTQACTDGNSGSIGNVTSMWLDSSGGMLYFTDNYCNTLRTVSNGTLATVVGNGMEGYVEASNGQLSNAELYDPMSVVRIGNKSYVAEGGSRIRVVDHAQGATATLAGEQFGATPPNYIKTGSGSQYTVMDGMVSDGTNLYGTVDYRHELLTISLADGGTTSNTTWAGIGGTPVPTPGALTRIGSTLYAAFSDGSVRSIGTDGTGDASLVPKGASAPLTALTTDGTSLYGLDQNNVVSKIGLPGGLVQPIVGHSGSTAVLDGNATTATFATPVGLVYANGMLYTTDGGTTIYTRDNTVVRSIDLVGNVKTIAGTNGTRGTMDGTGTSATFGGLQGLSTDGTSLFLVDFGLPYTTNTQTYGPNIRQLQLADTSVTTMLGVVGQVGNILGVGTKASFNSVQSLTFDQATHSIYLFSEAELLRLH